MITVSDAEGAQPGRSTIRDPSLEDPEGDAREVVPTCSAAWVGLVRRNGEDDDGVDLKDAESGFTLDDIVLPAGALPRSASGIESGGVAVGFDTGHTIELYVGSDPVGSVDLSKYADATDTVHVAALAAGKKNVLAVLDAGDLTNAIALVLDSEAVVSSHELSTADISAEIAIVDDGSPSSGVAPIRMPSRRGARRTGRRRPSMPRDAVDADGVLAARRAPPMTVREPERARSSRSRHAVDLDGIAAPSLVRGRARRRRCGGLDRFLAIEGDDGQWSRGTTRLESPGSGVPAPVSILNAGRLAIAP